MAYIVLALGAFLSIGGALSIYGGAGIVEVERGWTAVIAGATSLTGGIVTIALGLILKALLDLRAGPALRAPSLLRTVEPAAPEPAAPEPAALNVAEDRHGGHSVPAGNGDLDSGLLDAFLSPRRPGRTHPDEAEAEAIPHRDIAREEAVTDPALPESVASFEVEPEPLKSRFRLGFRKPVSRLGSEMSKSEAGNRQIPDYENPETDVFAPDIPELEAASSHAPDPAAAPAMDDWLDRAFSSIDSEVTAGGLNRQLDPHDHQSTPRETEAFEAVANEPAVPEDVRPGLATTTAVIGRYEADGTSYVMFADGSIEAHSDAGVYRFSSMTELKAHIEGTG